MKQVVIIHGGDAFATYEEYLDTLENATLDDPRLRTKGWKSLLPENLGPEYEVLAPRMPNSANAKYIEWKIWFEKHFPFLNDEVLLVGHSLGAVFLAKYLSESTFPKKIAATFLIAGPKDWDDECNRPLHEFAVQGPLDRLQAQGGKIFLYHSSDDPIVAITEFEKYQQSLPTATFRALDGRGHFVGDEFPELLADIRSV